MTQRTAIGYKCKECEYVFNDEEVNLQILKAKGKVVCPKCECENIEHNFDPNLCREIVFCAEVDGFLTQCNKPREGRSPYCSRHTKMHIRRMSKK